METGYIKLHRSMRDWEWYHDLPVYRLFTCMLFMANWKDKRWQGLEIKRGQFVSSISNLSAESDLTVKQVRGALKKLESTGEVASKRTNKYSLYTIINYSSYQDDPRPEGNQKGKREAGEGQAEGTLRANKGQQLKKDKKERKEEGKSMSHPFASEVVTRWNALAAVQPNLATVKTVSKTRANKLNTRIKEGFTIEQFVKVLEEVEVSDFLLGKSGDWAVTFDWLITNDSNWVKVVEGNYRNKEQSGRKSILFESTQERRSREIREQKERMLRELGGGESDKATDDYGEFIDPVRVF